MKKEMNNPYINELNKFLYKEAIVKDSFGELHEGIVVGYNHQHLNVILMTLTEKIVIKNPQLIRRKRGGELILREDINVADIPE